MNFQPLVMGSSGAYEGLAPTAALARTEVLFTLSSSEEAESFPSRMAPDEGPMHAVTGFPPGTLTPPAVMHVTDPTAAQAQVDLTTAYICTAGLPGGAVLPGNMSGLTFTPGLYKTSSTVMLSAGNVTLDAQGDVNAVFIFQVASTLTTIGSTQVVLAGGAQARNVFWQTGRPWARTHFSRGPSWLCNPSRCRPVPRLKAGHWHAMARSLWTATRLLHRSRHQAPGSRSVLGRLASGLKIFTPAKLGEVFRCRLALVALVASMT